MTAAGKPLADRLVAISVSGNEDLEPLGYTETHLHDLCIRLARQLLGLGASIAYGGVLGSGTVTSTVHGIARHEALDHPSRQPGAKRPAPFVNYLAWDYHTKLSKKAEAAERGVCSYVRVDDRADMAMTATEQQDEAAATIRRRSHALTRMRRWLATEADAAILIGGKRTNFQGLMPGVLEEALYHLEAGHPLYLVGGFGGIVADLAQALRAPGEDLGPVLIGQGEVGTPKFHHLLDVYPENVELGHDVSYEEASKSYDRLTATIGLLRSAGLQNGLTDAQNHALWASEDVTEIVGLVRTGLEQAL